MADAPPDVRGKPGFRFGQTALVREAALSYGLLDRLISPAAESRLAEIREIDRELEPLAETLIAAVHAAIPGLDKQKRRQALALKRGMFCHRLDIDAALARTLLDELGCPPSISGRWVDGAERLGRILEAARTGFAEDQAGALDTMIREALSNEQFASGVAVTSPGVFARLPDLERGGKKSRHIRAKLLKFAVKATYKSAPLNRLAGLALMVGRDLVSREPLSEMRPNQEFLYARSAGYGAAGIRYRLNGSAEWAGGVCSFYGTKLTQIGTSRRSTNSHVRFPDALAAELKKLGPDDVVSVAGLRSLMLECGLSETDSARYERFMVAGGLLLPDAVDGLRLTNEELYRQLEEEGLDDEAAELRRLEAVLTDPAADGRQRQEAATRYSHVSGGPATNEGGDGAAAVYETLWQPSAVSAELLDEVRERRFPDFLARLPDYMVVAPLYGRLLRDFQRRFGAGGRCDNLLQWLRRVDLEGPPDAGMGGGGGEVTAPIGLTVYFSLLQPSAGAPAGIQCQNIHSRIGWQLGRFAYGASEPARRLRESVCRDIEAFVAPARPVTLSADSDLVNIQSNPALFEPVIVAPNQSRPRRKAVSPEQISARHDPATNRIHLYLGDEEISPIYNGGMIPDPRFGVPYLMTVLSEPFRLKPFGPTPRAPEERIIHRVDPILIEGVLAARGYWWIPMEIVAPAFEASGFDRFMALRKLWREHGLDERAFVCGFSGAVDSAYARVRPKISQSRWFDVRVETCIEFLASILDHDWVLLQDCTNRVSLTLGESGEGRVTSICTEVYYDEISCSLG
ncbi:MAG: hypothetical protein ACXW27_02225 [Allosphingosinicella sp.]